MAKIAVITGAGAGVGRATALEFAQNGFDVALLSRDPDRLDALAAKITSLGRRALPIPTDVADSDQVEAAASRVEGEFGPIDTWVNVAMATVFSPVADLAPKEALRATEVTYLGQVYGMMAALKRMRIRNRGTIVNVGSALAYRSVPLQSVYCGAKAAIRGFTDIHDGLNIQLTMVHLPAVNTPQFDWALNKTKHRAQPVPPISEPEVAARAIFFRATHTAARCGRVFRPCRRSSATASSPDCSTAISPKPAIAGSFLVRRNLRMRRQTCFIRCRAMLPRMGASMTGQNRSAGRCTLIATAMRLPREPRSQRDSYCDRWYGGGAEAA
jgi:NADP-dependent 3-hydroxy acid dehydrogenase YdfG